MDKGRRNRDSSLAMGEVGRMGTGGRRCGSERDMKETIVC
jgi:hypothetical protein